MSLLRDFGPFFFFTILLQFIKVWGHLHSLLHSLLKSLIRCFHTLGCLLWSSSFDMFVYMKHFQFGIVNQHIDNNPSATSNHVRISQLSQFQPSSYFPLTAKLEFMVHSVTARFPGPVAAKQRDQRCTTMLGCGHETLCLVLANHGTGH